MSSREPFYIELMYNKIMSDEADTTTKTTELEVLGIMIEVTKSLNKTGELGNLSEEQIKLLDAKLQLIRHLLSSRTDKSKKAGYNLTTGIYNQDFLSFVEMKKKGLISLKGTNLNKYFEEGLTGGQRGRKTKSKKSKSKKTKSRVRKH